MINIINAISSISQEEQENGDYSRFYIGNDKFDQAIVEEINNYVNNKSFSDMKRFFSKGWSETARDQRKGKFMAVDAPLGNILFEVEIK